MSKITPTFGSAARRLRELGYSPVSAVAPYGLFDESVTGKFREWTDCEVSEHPVAVLLSGGRQNFCVLQVNPTQIVDAECLERTRELLRKAGLTAGPCRVGSDGCECWPLRVGIGRPSATALGGAVVIGAGTLLPLDATWRNGSLLDVPARELPAVEPDAVQALLAEVNRLPYLLAEERRPPPQPTIEAWIGA